MGKRTATIDVDPPGLLIRRARLDDLHLDPGNARSHPEPNMAAIRASLATFGQVEPLVVHKGTNKVIGGNGRLAAMRELGLAECDVVEFDGSPTQAVALGIALNRSASLAEWNDTALADTLRALQSEDFDLAAVGYRDDEVDALIEGLAREAAGPIDPPEDPGPQVDRAEELREKWGCHRGDLWVIPSVTTPGREHRLLCGDSTDEGDVARMMGGETAEVGITSPPFNLGDDHHTGARKTQAYPDDLPEPEYRAAQIAMLDLWAGHIRGDFFYQHKNRIKDGLWLSPPDWIRLSAWRLNQEIVWINGSQNFDACRFYPMTERIYWLTKDDENGPVFENKESLPDYWQISPVGADGLHTRAYPVEIPRRLIVASGARLVVDPYLGSGTTLVAAEQTGRLGYGVEISPAYCGVILERLSGCGLHPRLADAAGERGAA